MTKQYKSEALASAHEAALGLAEAGLMSKRTMRKFDEMCLTPVEEMTPEAIRELRLRERSRWRAAPEPAVSAGYRCGG